MRKFSRRFDMVRLFLALTAFLAGASFCIAGSEWHNQPSFFVLNQLPIPWWFYGVFLIVASLCLFVRAWRPVGFLVGGIIYSIFALSAWLAVLGGFGVTVSILAKFPANTVGSFFAAGNITTIAVLYWRELHDAIYTPEVTVNDTQSME